AIASARTGAKTLIVERHHWLGGHMTAGVDVWPYAPGDTKRIVAGSIAKEIIERLRKNQAVLGDPVNDFEILIDGEQMKYELDLLMNENSVEVLYDCWFADVIKEKQELKGVIVETKSGRRAILSKVVVDTTGDADVAARAGAPFFMEPRDQIMPVSVCARILNVDVEKLEKDNPQEKVFPGAMKGFTHPGIRSWKPLERILRNEKKNGNLEPKYEYLMNWFFFLGGTARLYDGEMILIMTGEKEVYGTEVDDISRALPISRRRVQEALQCLKKYVPAFKNAYLGQTGVLGVRETRRITGDYVLTMDDVLSCRPFVDVVARGSAPPGPHTGDGSTIEDPPHILPPKSFEVPLRALIPQKVENIVVAGRCISCDHNTTGSIRVMGACFATGQAAGVIAAVASMKGVKPRNIDARDAQAVLAKQGVDLSRIWEKN
ncbi:MAG: FAD-dependent oxidoreductase, partial [Planctomycetes bacterium]|nr:FAD-dependent oxidoreductase [Planctomycetota bacterium]